MGRRRDEPKRLKPCRSTLTDVLAIMCPIVGIDLGALTAERHDRPIATRGCARSRLTGMRRREVLDDHLTDSIFAGSPELCLKTSERLEISHRLVEGSRAAIRHSNEFSKTHDVGCCLFRCTDA